MECRSAFVEFVNALEVNGDELLRGNASSGHVVLQVRDGLLLDAIAGRLAGGSDVRRRFGISRRACSRQPHDKKRAPKSAKDDWSFSLCRSRYYGDSRGAGGPAARAKVWHSAQPGRCAPGASDQAKLIWRNPCENDSEKRPRPVRSRLSRRRVPQALRLRHRPLQPAPAAPASIVVAAPTYTSIPLEIAVNRPAAEVWKRVGKPRISASRLRMPLHDHVGQGRRDRCVRSVATEVLVSKTELSYTYTQPVREGRPYNLYHGTLEAAGDGDDLEDRFHVDLSTTRCWPTTPRGAGQGAEDR